LLSVGKFKGSGDELGWVDLQDAGVADDKLILGQCLLLSVEGLVYGWLVGPEVLDECVSSRSATLETEEREGRMTRGEGVSIQNPAMQ